MLDNANVVVLAFGDEPSEKTVRILHAYNGIEVDHVIECSKEQPYVDHPEWTGVVLCHIHNNVYYGKGLHLMENLRHCLPIKEVGLPEDAIKRADLVLVAQVGLHDEYFYFPYTKATATLPSKIDGKI